MEAHGGGSKDSHAKKKGKEKDEARGRGGGFGVWGLWKSEC